MQNLESQFLLPLKGLPYDEIAYLKGMELYCEFKLLMQRDELIHNGSKRMVYSNNEISEPLEDNLQEIEGIYLGYMNSVEGRKEYFYINGKIMAKEFIGEEEISDKQIYSLSELSHYEFPFFSTVLYRFSEYSLESVDNFIETLKADTKRWLETYRSSYGEIKFKLSQYIGRKLAEHEWRILYEANLTSLKEIFDYIASYLYGFSTEARNKNDTATANKGLKLLEELVNEIVATVN